VAVDQGNNVLMTGSLTASDLQNKDEYSASGYSLSGSVSGQLGNQTDYNKSLRDKGYTEEQMKAVQGQPTASGGFGSASGSQNSITHSGISGGLVVITDQVKQLSTGKDGAGVLATIDQTVTTESAAANASSLTKGWDAQQLQKEVDAQVAITKEFSKQAPKAIADFAQSQIKALEKAGASDEEIAKWREGGVYRIALHTVSGGLTGGLGGALGSATVAGSADYLEKLQSMTMSALVEQGLSSGTAQMFAQGLAEATSLAIGTGVGGIGGGASALGTDTNNRQLHLQEIAKIETLAKEQAKKTCRGDADCEAKAYIMWADALERTAKGLVDEKESAKNLAYIQTLAAASNDPNSEGARGRFAEYMDVLRIAQSLLTSDMGKVIVVNGQTASANGSVQTYFSATQAQFLDKYVNTLFSRAPDSIVVGEQARDNTRIEVFGAQNGSATPMYVAEELLLGGAVANKAVASLGRYFASLDVGLAGTVGTSAGGNISALKMTEESMSLGVSAGQRSVLAQLEGLANNNVSGDLREFVANNYFSSNGFKSLQGKCGSNCFDGVYIKGDSVYINEVKPLTAEGSIQLSGPSATGLPAQMSDDWIKNVLGRLKLSTDPATLETAKIVQKAIDDGKLIKMVTGVNSKEMRVIKIK
jgi:filamentous hemagglutinin